MKKPQETPETLDHELDRKLHLGSDRQFLKHTLLEPWPLVSCANKMKLIYFLARQSSW